MVRTIAAIVAADGVLARRRPILASIPCSGAVTAMVILVGVLELGGPEGKQAPSLAGLAPMTRESGS